MLKQILEDMYVDTELLGMLDEEQKQVLFREIRKEQVRRWEDFERKPESPEKKLQPKRSKKKLGFHTATDGKEWVWVLGEAKGDLNYQDLVRKNNRDRKELKRLASLNLEDRDGSKRQEDNVYEEDKLIEVQWKEREDRAKMIERQRRVSFTKAATNQYMNIKHVLDTLPQDKQSTISTRLSKRKASISISRQMPTQPSQKIDPKTYPPIDFVSALSIRGTRPANRDLTKDWFKEIEWPKGVGQNVNGTIAEWFHGIISRDEAESMLSEMDNGAYMVRVSDKIWGYVLSMNVDGKFKHFRIDASYGTYQMVDDGLGGPVHGSLIELLLFYKQTQESRILRQPCPQKDPKTPDYSGLIDDDCEDSATTFL